MPPGAPLQAYAVLVYHLPLSIAFSTQRRAPFVWGGCMLLRARELAAGGRGALQVWLGAAGPCLLLLMFRLHAFALTRDQP